MLYLHRCPPRPAPVDCDGAVLPVGAALAVLETQQPSHVEAAALGGHITRK